MNENEILANCNNAYKVIEVLNYISLKVGLPLKKYNLPDESQHIVVFYYIDDIICYLNFWAMKISAFDWQWSYDVDIGFDVSDSNLNINNCSIKDVIDVINKDYLAIKRYKINKRIESVKNLFKPSYIVYEDRLV